jgi:hypothetical protein
VAGATAPVKDRFVELAGEDKARIVVIPTGASLIKFGRTTPFSNRTGREIDQSGRPMKST